MVAAYRDTNRSRAIAAMTAVIKSVSSGVSAAPTDLRRLGRTLSQRAGDILAYFDRPGTSNGPTHAINGRLKHSAAVPSASNIINLHARSLLETGGFRPRLHPGF